MEQISGIRPVVPAHADFSDDTHQPARPSRRRRVRPHQECVCNFTQALEQALARGRDRAAARGIRLHAYMAEDLCVAEDWHSVLCTLDAMLAMATGLAARDSLVVCQAKAVGGKVRVLLQFAGGPTRRDASADPVLDCDLRREWSLIPASS